MLTSQISPYSNVSYVYSMHINNLHNITSYRINNIMYMAPYVSYIIMIYLNPHGSCDVLIVNLLFLLIHYYYSYSFIHLYLNPPFMDSYYYLNSFQSFLNFPLNEASIFWLIIFIKEKLLIALVFVVILCYQDFYLCMVEFYLCTNIMDYGIQSQNYYCNLCHHSCNQNCFTQASLVIYINSNMEDLMISFTNMYRYE